MTRSMSVIMSVSLWSIISEYTYRSFSGINKVCNNPLTTDLCSVVTIF